MEKLSPVQEKVLEFIRAHLSREGIPPTIREIGRALGTKSSTIHFHLKALERKGHLRRAAAKARSLQVTGFKKGSAEIPLLGTVPAGPPLLAVENIEEYLPLDPDFWKLKAGRPGNLFALRVKGKSMIGDGIQDGDIVIVREQGRVENGELAVALVEGEATVKRFRREGEKIILQPSNPGFSPLVYRSGGPEPRILGKVVGVVRRYR